MKRRDGKLIVQFQDETGQFTTVPTEVSQKHNTTTDEYDY